MRDSMDGTSPSRERERVGVTGAIGGIFILDAAARPVCDGVRGYVRGMPVRSGSDFGSTFSDSSSMISMFFVVASTSFVFSRTSSSRGLFDRSGLSASLALLNLSNNDCEER